MDKIFLEELTKLGLSQRQIADKCGKSQTSIRYWLHTFELGTQRNHKCSLCGETDPAKFTSGRFRECRRCRCRYQTQRFRSYKKKAVAYKGGKCEKCGYDRCLAAMDFHHIDPSKKDPKWKLMKNWTFEKVKEELDKCMLVCKNCHAEIHFRV